MNYMQCIVVEVPNLEIKTNTVPSPHDSSFSPGSVCLFFSVGIFGLNF